MTGNRWIDIARRRRGLLVIIAAWVALLVTLIAAALLAPGHVRTQELLHLDQAGPTRSTDGTTS
jgi:hypothetical protein